MLLLSRTVEEQQSRDFQQQQNDSLTTTIKKTWAKDTKDGLSISLSLYLLPAVESMNKLLQKEFWHSTHSLVEQDLKKYCRTLTNAALECTHLSSTMYGNPRRTKMKTLLSIARRLCV